MGFVFSSVDWDKTSSADEDTDVSSLEDGVSDEPDSDEPDSDDPDYTPDYTPVYVPERCAR